MAHPTVLCLSIPGALYNSQALRLWGDHDDRLAGRFQAPVFAARSRQSLRQPEGGRTNTLGTLQDQSEGEAPPRRTALPRIPPDAWKRTQPRQIEPQFEAPA